MPRMTPCPTCHSHVFADARECPHCGAALATRNKALVPAVLVGLALTGCPTRAEPEYGVPDTGPQDESGTATGSETATTSMGEPEYGVPDTGPTDTETAGTETGTTSMGEPEYGVPETTT
jgi:hypothetical protein